MASEAVMRDADLRYVLDSEPGIRRMRRRGTFEYLLPDGEPVRDAATLQRIKLLAVPPAWEPPRGTAISRLRAGISEAESSTATIRVGVKFGTSRSLAA
jgi:hypothetical protein